jgi:prepilin-type N-terminal cleavage/methylation domain-containing protein
MRDRSTHRQRRGFTLIELLIVISILVILIALAAGLSPKGSATQKMFQATNTITGALMMAKQRAKRDRLPTGVRLIRQTDPDATPYASANANYVSDLVLIQQPDDLTGGQPGAQNGAMFNGANSGTQDKNDPEFPFPPPRTQPLMKLNTQVFFTGNVNFMGSGGANRALVQQGDYLEINGGGMPHLILNAGRSNLTLQISPDTACYIGSTPTSNWRIIRAPRALIGEVPIHLKSNIIIDITQQQPYNPAMPSSQNIRVTTVTNPPHFDILFSPGGAVIATGNTVLNPAQPGDSNVYLYVRDLTESSNLSGYPAIVTVFSRSGFVKVSPVDQPPDPDPFSFAKDARGSGQ